MLAMFVGLGSNDGETKMSVGFGEGAGDGFIFNIFYFKFFID